MTERATATAFRSRLGLAWVLTFFCVGWTSCAGDEPPPTAPPRLVVTAPVHIEDAVEQVEILGEIHGAREVRVMAQVPERIRILHVQEGDVVQAGDPILTLEASLQASSLQQASAAVDVAEAARDQLAADSERVRRLVEQGAAPRSQLDALRAQLRTSEAQLSQVRAARRTAGEQRSRTVVRAPVEGTVALLTVQQGDMVAPSLPICSLVRTDRLLVRLRVTERDYVRVRAGMSAELRPPALLDVVRVGTVSRISPVLDRVTRTGLVEVELDNPDGLLRPGMVTSARIELSRRPDTVLAPARALVLDARTRDERRAAVFIHDREAGVARRRSVVLGGRFDGRIEVTEGLEGGEEVVVQGQHLLRDGAQIRTQAPSTSAESEGRRS